MSLLNKLTNEKLIKAKEIAQYALSSINKLDNYMQNEYASAEKQLIDYLDNNLELRKLADSLINNKTAYKEMDLLLVEFEEQGQKPNALDDKIKELNPKLHKVVKNAINTREDLLDEVCQAGNLFMFIISDTDEEYYNKNNKIHLFLRNTRWEEVFGLKEKKYIFYRTNTLLKYIIIFHEEYFNKIYEMPRNEGNQLNIVKAINKYILEK